MTSQASTDQSRGPENWQGIFEDVAEIDSQIKEISGQIPEELVGTLFLNGPGKRRFSKSFFDGDGMVRALHIKPQSQVQLHTRFVQTPKYLKEANSHKAKVRTAGSNLPGGLLTNLFKLPADEANTHIFDINGKLLASEEGGHPWHIDPVTLDTLGEEHFSGALPRNIAFSAHPHYDSNTKEFYNFGMKPGKQMGFQCFKIDKQQKLSMLASFSCNKGTFAHDYALSGKWMAFILPPLAGNLTKFIFGFASFFDTMRWHEEWGSQIVLVPRDGGKALRFETEAFSIGHIISAWDEGDDLFIDLSTSPDMEVMKDVGNYRNSEWNSFGGGCISRLRINTKTMSLEKHTITDIPAEFPRIHPERECIKTDFGFLACNTQAGEGGLYRASMKLNRETGDCSLFDFGKNCVALEPVFIPKLEARSEDDGWLMVHVYDSQEQRSKIAILDSMGISDGPVATLHLPIAMGTTFHGSWLPAKN